MLVDVAVGIVLNKEPVLEKETGQEKKQKSPIKGDEYGYRVFLTCQSCKVVGSSWIVYVLITII